MRTRDQRLLIAVAAAHVVLLAAYTFPQQLVPERLRVIGQFYARPLFHQQWRLFAPDPPLCSCGLEWSTDGSLWHGLGAGKHTYLNRRVVQSIARHAQSRAHSGDTALDGPIADAVRGIIRGEALDSSRSDMPVSPRIRLVEQCVTDSRRPAAREQRTMEMRLP
ncbi:MAG: hypothetical protein IPM46_10675 [Flavobacteriales bacterium]|nr:hypothetical protein [Flavobacteriales bacterium]